MASLHDDLMTAAAVPVLFAHLAETFTVSYTPRGGSATEYDAIVGNEISIEVQTKTERVKKRVRTVTFLASDLTSPQIRATVAIDSVSYAVERIDASGQGMVVLEVARPEPMEKHAEGYRQARVGMGATD